MVQQVPGAGVAGSPSPGRCPAGGHNHAGSANYVLAFPAAAWPGRSRTGGGAASARGWRWPAARRRARARRAGIMTTPAAATTCWRGLTTGIRSGLRKLVPPASPGVYLPAGFRLYIRCAAGSAGTTARARPRGEGGVAGRLTGPPAPDSDQDGDHRHDSAHPVRTATRIPMLPPAPAPTIAQLPSPRRRLRLHRRVRPERQARRIDLADGTMTAVPSGLENVVGR